jgi:hypothetical protein
MSDVWTSFVLKNAVRVLPLTLSKDERLRRQQYCHKLAGIPRNCLAGDLVEFLKNINAKSCFIPRNFQTYRQQNFAFVNFANQEDFTQAPLTSYSFKGAPLFWCDTSTKTCFTCGSPDHSVKVCPKRNASRDPKKQQLERLYTKFRPAQHKKRPNDNQNNYNQRGRQQQQRQPNLSYADMAKRNSHKDQPHRPWNRQNLQTPRPQDNDARYKELHDILQQLTQQVQQYATTWEKKI